MTFRLFSPEATVGGYHTLARSVGSLAQNAGSSSDDNVPIVSGMRCLAAHLPLAQRVVPGTTLHSRSLRELFTISVCVRFAARHFFVPS